MLSRIKLSFSEIRSAILGVDDKLLSLDELKVIARHVPTSDEVSPCLVLKCLNSTRNLARSNELDKFEISERSPKLINIFTSSLGYHTYKSGWSV